LVTFRSFEALLAGLAGILLLVGLVRSLVIRFVPDWAGQGADPGPGGMLVQLGATFLSSAAGGCLTAWVSPADPLRHVFVLGLVVLVLGALSVREARQKVSIGFRLALIAIAPLGVVAGGLARLRILGVF
jgi:hypothetical protein